MAGKRTCSQGCLTAVAIPVAVFMGGTPESPLVTIYSRPLIPKDFNELFSGKLKGHGKIIRPKRMWDIVEQALNIKPEPSFFHLRRQRR